MIVLIMIMTTVITTIIVLIIVRYSFKRILLPIPNPTQKSTCAEWTYFMPRRI